MKEIDAGAGYRLLREGEIICAEDAWRDSHGNWIADGSGLGQKYNASLWQPFRRKVEDRWIPLSERLPDKFPCQIYGPKVFRDTIALREDAVNGRVFTSTDSWLYYKYFTHWKPLRLSDPPEPEVSEEEKAFDNFFGDKNGAYSAHWRTWLAALAWERGRK